jgi:hypothetical protein
MTCELQAAPILEKRERLVSLFADALSHLEPQIGFPFAPMSIDIQRDLQVAVGHRGEGAQGMLSPAQAPAPSGFSASFLASALAFFITGYYTLVFSTADSGLIGVFQVEVMIAILVNAVYFYYWIAFAEMHEETRERLSRKGHLEWVLRIANQTILFSLWFTLAEGKWTFFGLGLPILYALYLAWDVLALHSEWREHKRLFALDTVGLLISLVFWHLFSRYVELMSVPTDPLSRDELLKHWQNVSTASILLGTACAAYTVMAAVGVFVGFSKYRFNPCSKKYWTASAIR